MKETYYIGAFWGRRFESRSACAERLQQWMSELASCHELLSNWYETANSLRQALQKRISPTHDALEYLLEPYRSDEPDPELEQEFLKAIGYSFYCWNGQADDNRSMSFDVSCGGAIDVPGISNRVVLELPEPSDAVVSLYDPDVLFRSLHAIIRAWEPDWAILMNRAYRDRYIHRDDYEPPPGKPYVGWMTYLRAKRLRGLADVPPREVPCEVIDVPERGKIFVVTRAHRFSIENPGDIARAQELTAFLESHGALVPIPPDEPF